MATWEERKEKSRIRWAKRQRDALTEKVVNSNDRPLVAVIVFLLIAACLMSATIFRLLTLAFGG